MIKVLIVEDSAVVREFLIHIFGSDPDVEIVGTAFDGEEAVEAVREKRPDVITMDIHMPRLNGLEATRRIMETRPTPIVIVSGSTDPKEVATTFAAMEAGALAVLRRPAGIGHPEHENNARDLLQTVKLMSEVRVVRRWSRGGAPAPPVERARRGRIPSQIEVVVIGASAGGPPVLRTILSSLSRDFPLPMLIVQHMAAGFMESFVRWLGETSELPIALAVHDDVLRPGRVLLAPDGMHMKVRENRIVLTAEAPENGLRPAISPLFRSVRQSHGGRVAAGLLSGMGRDGADELRRLRESGAFTFVQDRESAAVYGMPGEAIKLDAATIVLPPERIAATLMNIAERR